jgi:hypothetical protein
MYIPEMDGSVKKSYRHRPVPPRRQSSAPPPSRLFSTHTATAPPRPVLWKSNLKGQFFANFSSIHVEYTSSQARIYWTIWVSHHKTRTILIVDLHDSKVLSWLSIWMWEFYNKILIGKVEFYRLVRHWDDRKSLNSLFSIRLSVLAFF